MKLGNGRTTCSLASSIYMVCCKRLADASVGEYLTVRWEIEELVRKRLAQF